MLNYRAPKLLDKLRRPGEPRFEHSGDVLFCINTANYHLGRSHSSYIAKEDSSLVLCGTAEDGSTVSMVVERFFPYTYLMPKDEQKIRTLIGAGEGDFLEKTKEYLEERLAESTSLKGDHVYSVEIVMKTPLVGVYFEKQRMLKITLFRPGHIVVLRDLIRKSLIFGEDNTRMFECNVNFVQRLLVDKDIPGMGWVSVLDGNYFVIPPNSIDRATKSHLEIVVDSEHVISRPDITKLPPVFKMGWDTEQLARDGFPDASNLEHQTITHGIVLDVEDENGVVRRSHRVALSVGPCSIDDGHVISVSTPAELAVLFKDFMNIVDPDFIIGFNSISHDMGFTIDSNRANNLHERDGANANDFCRQKGNVCVARDVRLESGAVGTLPYRFTEMDRNQLDLLVAVRRMLKLDSYRLNNVASKIVGEYKDPVSYGMIPDLHEGSDEDRALLTEYCVKDAKLPMMIDSIKRFSRLYRSIANFCRTPFMMILLRGTQVLLQAVFLQYLRKHKRDYVMDYYEPPPPELDEHGKEDKGKKKAKYDGAVVLDPLRLGLYLMQIDGAIIALDFASHYPLIMVSQNLCYTTLVHKDDVDKIRAMDIPVRQGPSPTANPEENRMNGLPVLEGHYFIYPWRECTKDEAMRHMIQKHRVRQIMENSYLLEENRIRKEQGKPLDLPVLEAGQWQWEDPELIGVLPQMVIDLLAQRKIEKGHLGAVQKKIKFFTQAMGIRGFLDGNAGSIELITGKKVYEKWIAKKPAAGETPMDMLAWMLCNQLVGRKNTKNRLENCETTRDILHKVLEKAVGELWDESKKIYEGRQLERVAGVLKDLKALEGAHDGGQAALKVLCNSSYGFTGAQTGKLPCFPISATVTAYGRDMIMYAKRVVETRDEDTGTYGYIGYPDEIEVIYGDTDSVMFRAAGCHDNQEAIDWGRKFSAYVSIRYQHPSVKLEFEKIYTVALFLQKKRYIAMMEFENQNKDIERAALWKGLEVQRMDNPLGFRILIMKACSMLLELEIDQSLMVIFRMLQTVQMDEMPLKSYEESKSSGKRTEDFKVPTSFAKFLDRQEEREPGSVDRSGRQGFVHVVNLDKKAKGKDEYKDLSKSLESVNEVMENPEKYTLDREHYIENLKKIIGRLYADIVSSNTNRKKKFPTYKIAKKEYAKRSTAAARLIFNGEHMKTFRGKFVFDNIHSAPAKKFEKWIKEDYTILRLWWTQWIDWTEPEDESKMQIEVENEDVEMLSSEELERRQFRIVQWKESLASGDFEYFWMTHEQEKIRKEWSNFQKNIQEIGWSMWMERNLAKFPVPEEDEDLLDTVEENASKEFKNTPEWQVWRRYRQKHGHFPRDVFLNGIPTHYIAMTSGYYWRYMMVMAGNRAMAISDLKETDFFIQVSASIDEWNTTFLNTGKWPSNIDILRHPSDAMRKTPEFQMCMETHRNDIYGGHIYGPIAPAHLTKPLTPFNRETISVVQSDLNLDEYK